MRKLNFKIGDKLYCKEKRQIMGVDYGGEYTIKQFKNAWFEGPVGDYEALSVMFEETGNNIYNLEYFAKQMPMRADPVRLDEDLFKI
jgi:hypothetical protein